MAAPRRWSQYVSTIPQVTYPLQFNPPVEAISSWKGAWKGERHHLYRLRGRRPHSSSSLATASADDSDELPGFEVRALEEHAQPYVEAERVEASVGRNVSVTRPPAAWPHEEQTSGSGKTDPRPFAVTVDGSCFQPAIQTLKLARHHGLPDHAISSPLLEEAWEEFSITRPGRMAYLSARSAGAKRKFRTLSRQEPLRSRRRERSKLPMMAPAVRAELLDLTDQNEVVVIVSDTGSGKTTQVPQVLLDHAIEAGRGAFCNIICTQPRRLSATSIAHRVAFERGEGLQQSVGHHVRFSHRPPVLEGSITYCTTGVLLKRLQEDPTDILWNYSHIIIDEVHERSSPVDLLLASLRNLIQYQRFLARPCPKVLLMSATIEAGRFVEYFRLARPGQQPLRVSKMHVKGRAYDVETHFLPDILQSLHANGSDTDATVSSLLSGSKQDPSTSDYLRAELAFAGKEQPLPAEPTCDAIDESEDPGSSVNTSLVDAEALVPIGLIAVVVAHVARSTNTGDILVFLPGLQEIDRVADTLQTREMLGLDFNDATTFKLFKLHSSLYDTNDDVFKPVPEECRRVVLATNIAETSITLPQVVHVIDSGKAREMRYDQVGGASEFACKWITKASSLQRRGRAGRVQNGHYYALFTDQRYHTLHTTAEPEILKTDLVGTCLDIKAQATPADIEGFLQDAIDPPSPHAVAAAIQTLQNLGAFTEQNEITPLGRILAALPIHPALAKGILLGLLFRCVEPMLIIACHVQDDPLINHPFDRSAMAEARRQYSGRSQSDLFAFINAFKEFHVAERMGDQTRVTELIKTRFIRPNIYHEMMLVSAQIHEILVRMGFLPPAQPCHSVFETIPPDLNLHSENEALVTALALNTVNSNVAIWAKAPAKSWVTEDASVKSLMDPRSVNQPPKKTAASDQRKRRMSGQLLAYTTRRRTKGDKVAWLMETSMITPIMAILFGRSATLQSPEVVNIDGWLALKIGVEDDSLGFGAAQPARILVELRKALDRFLALAFSDLRDMHLDEYESRAGLSQLDQRAGTDPAYNAMFTTESELRDVVVNGILDVLHRDAAAVREREAKEGEPSAEEEKEAQPAQY